MTDSSNPAQQPAQQSLAQQNLAELPAQLEALGGQLVWRIGKDELSEAVVVRIGFASSTPRFAFLPRLRTANDEELQEAMQAGKVVIEWVD